MARPGLMDRLRKATGYVSPAEHRELETYREAYSNAWREWHAGDRSEDFVDPIVAEAGSKRSVWKAKLEIEDYLGDDPFEEGRAFLNACEQYDEKLEVQGRSYRERAAATSDARERRRADALADEVEAERDALDEMTRELWGRVFRPAVRGQKDELREALGCRCSRGCPRLFRSSHERKAAPRGWHPSCIAEARAKQGETLDPYVAELVERLPA